MPTLEANTLRSARTAGAQENILTSSYPTWTIPLPGGGSNSQCATCHQEHGNRANDLTALDDRGCQVCHVERFSNFDEHEPFESYPQARKTDIAFDHVSHVLNHFPDAELGDAPDACTSCHLSDASGERMLVLGYEAACASCHDTDIVGPSQIEGAGMAVLSLPALDTLTLEEQGIGIGKWPADSMITEAALTPFLALLLSSDTDLASDLELLMSVDLLDLTEAGEDELAAVARVAWGIKQLYADIAQGGHSALLERVTGLSSVSQLAGAAGQIPLREEELVHRLPEALVQRALESWLPGLEDELERHAAGESVPTDSTPGDAEPDLARDEAHERWVETGGWYLSELDFVIRYRPSGHADSFLRAWSDLSWNLDAEGTTLFDMLADPGAVGRCGKCHAPSEEGLRWRSSVVVSESRGLNRFSHIAHFASPSDNACLTCHVLERGERSDFIEAFRSKDSRSFVPSFKSMTKQTCAECHTQSGAGDSCLTCHVYHEDKGERRMPGASLDALR